MTCQTGMLFWTQLQLEIIASQNILQFLAKQGSEMEDVM